MKGINGHNLIPDVGIRNLLLHASNPFRLASSGYPALLPRRLKLSTHYYSLPMLIIVICLHDAVLCINIYIYIAPHHDDVLLLYSTPVTEFDRSETDKI